VDQAKYCVNAVLVEGRSPRAVAAATGRSKSWVQRHVALYQAGGVEALTPRKRGPKVPPNLTPSALEDEIVLWRKRLADDGLDAGARTISWHMAKGGGVVPALSTIHQVLVRRGLVTPQPQKRPRSSWMRFESDLPNETWQSDMTHWHLENDEPVEIINFIDDHSRAVLASVAVPVATAAEVVRIFYETAGAVRRCRPGVPSTRPPSPSTGSRSWPTPRSAGTASTRPAASPCATAPSSTTSGSGERTGPSAC
jgi:transposase